jgi:hypothetical protein
VFAVVSPSKPATRDRTARGQAAAAFVRLKAICRSLNLNFRIEISRPRTKA